MIEVNLILYKKIYQKNDKVLIQMNMTMNDKETQHSVFLVFFLFYIHKRYNSQVHIHKIHNQTRGTDFHHHSINFFNHLNVKSASSHYHNSTVTR